MDWWEKVWGPLMCIVLLLCGAWAIIGVIIGEVG